MTPKFTCGQCGEEHDQKTTKGRKRQFCPECSKKRKVAAVMRSKAKAKERAAQSVAA